MSHSSQARTSKEVHRMDMSSRASVKTQRSKAPSIKSKASSVKSKASSARSQKLDVEEKLVRLRIDFEEKVIEYENEVESSKDLLKTCEDDKEKEDILAYIAKYEAKIETAKKQYERVRAPLEELLRIKKRQEMIPEDDEQRLDSEDEELIKRFDRLVKDPEPSKEEKHVNPIPSVSPKEEPYFPPMKEPSNVSSHESLIQDLTTAISRAVGNKGSHSEKRLVEFDGNPGVWGNFSGTFWRTTRDFNISDSENMMRLQTALKGKARSSVEHLMYNVLNVKAIMQSLEEQFGKPEFVIDYLTEKAKSCKSPNGNDPQSIVDFGQALEALVVTIESYGKDEYWYNCHLVKEIADKLPGLMRKEWCQWQILNPLKSPNIQSFSEWFKLQRQIAQLQIKPSFSKEETAKKDDQRNKKNFAVHTSVKSDKKPKCFKCGSLSHQVGGCDKFKKLDVKARKEFSRENRLCFRCLKGKHLAADCRFPKQCDIEGCTSPDSHHPLLHVDKSKQVEEISEVEKSISTISAKENILPIVPCIVRGPKGKRKTYVMFDSAASFCMMEDELADEIGVEGENEPLEYDVFLDKRRESNSKVVSLEIAGDFNRAPFYQVKRVHTVRKMNLASRTFDAEEKKKAFPHLKDMGVKSIVKGRPQIILGINAGGLFAARKILEKSPGQAPAAVKSLLGWYFIEDEETAGKHLQFMSRDEEMHQQIKGFIMLENLGVRERPNNRSIEDQQALAILDEESTKVGNKWKTALLWRNKSLQLPESKQMALQRLSSMEKKMKRNPEFAMFCHAKFSDYIDSGYLKPVDSFDCDKIKSGIKVWYLPWFFAYHPSKKPRLVFDAAAKSKGMSFNDFLLTGPDFLRPLFAVLLRFRRHAIAVSADIQQMFHQVDLTEIDWSAQRILYTPPGETQPREYVMSVLFFGAACSPSCALYIKDRNAKDFKTQFPVAVHAIEKDFYMDDFLSGGETDDEALSLQRDVTMIHEAGGFPLVKWNSSSKTVYDQIPDAIKVGDKKKSASLVSDTIDLDSDRKQVLSTEDDTTTETPEAHQFQSKTEIEWEKTLGMLWSPESDEFSFQLSKEKIPPEVMSGERVPTKRMITSVVMSVFDPLGFLCILKMQGHLIIQEVWRQQVEWDERVSESIHEKWKNWLQDLRQVTELRIPRRLSMESWRNWKDVQLHVFCDASEVAYACCAYLRIDTGGRIATPFIMGKTRVGPVKGLSIPKMELNAALIAARLGKSIQLAYEDDLPFSQVTYWSDNETVLSQIRAKDKRHQIYVANRVDEILTLTEASFWRWVPSEENVADDATKIKTINLNAESRWFHGPDFLKKTPEEWPVEKPRQVLSIQVCAKKEEPPYLPNIDTFSSWYRLIRATASRFVALRTFKIYKKNRRGSRSRTSKKQFITLDDMRKAEVLWLKAHQEEYFTVEIHDLKTKGAVSSTSRIFSLSPILNTEGVLVMRGRLENAEVDEFIKHPPIMDSRGRYVELLIKWFHGVSQHYGQERIVNEVRKKGWVLNLRPAVKKCKAECIQCKIFAAKGIAPQMGQLPLGRVEEGQKPFHHTGVDYFGPMLVKAKRLREKRWGVIFTCMATRAVHLELAESLNTSDMLNTLVRFANIRGRPQHIWSDNGTNFVGAQREIADGIKKWNEDKIQDLVLSHGIEWHFIPPASPHMGGAWERLIRDVKRILNAMLKENYPTESTLRTFITEVSFILNSRPLTVVSTDPEDPQCITPNDLLNIGGVVGPTLPTTLSWDTSMRESWKRTQTLADQFWKRWSSEYLPWLARARKWNRRTRPLQVGDIVLLVEDNSPRNDWKKGFVEKVYPSLDGQVRFADVKIAYVDPKDPKNVKVTSLKRPAIKLCPLIMDD